MKADCKGRGSAPSSHHLSPSLLEKIQHQEMLWQNIFLATLVALHSTLHLSVVAVRLASFFTCFLTFIKASQEFQMLSRVTIYRSVTMNVEIVILNGQNCNQCHRGYKYQGSLFEDVLLLCLSLSLVETCDL